MNGGCAYNLSDENILDEVDVDVVRNSGFRRKILKSQERLAELEFLVDRARLEVERDVEDSKEVLDFVHRCDSSRIPVISIGLWWYSFDTKVEQCL